MPLFNKKHYKKILEILVKADIEYNNRKYYDSDNKMDYIINEFKIYFKEDNEKFNYEKFERYFNKLINNYRYGV